MIEPMLSPEQTQIDEGAMGILIVDDRPANLMAMVEALRELGHPIITASSGSEALRILIQQQFAVILLDVNMPGVGGFEVSKLIRARARSERTPIIFTTASSTGDTSVTQGYLLGAVDYVFSPFVPEILRAKVAVFVELQNKTKQLEQAAKRLEILLREKETLLQEVHHRVKNNLQVISSLISMQARQLRDGAAQNALRECKGRVQAIALIHEQLYQARDYARVPFSEYATNLVGNIFHATGISPANITLEVEVESIALAVDKAIPCGLILNELITNALKHAFTEEQQGVILVELRQRHGQVILAVTDNGLGLPTNFDIAKMETLGMQLVSTLVEQLDGQLTILQEEGTTFQITFLPTVQR